MTVTRRFVHHPGARDHVVTADDRAARAFHAGLPGYVPTPLRDAPDLAAALGVGRVWVKDESERLGLPSFKVLGASWAVARALTARLGDAAAGVPAAIVRRPAARFASLRPLTLVAPTDGNHGRAVAHVARLLGFGARILVPRDSAPARIAGIESEGATVVVVDGTYDETVIEAAKAEADPGCLVVSDTAWPGYDEIPRDVVRGYSTIFTEADEQLAAAAGSGPDLVVVPIGVGGLAAAAVRHACRAGAATHPRVLGVEPTRAACVLESLAAGHPVTLPGGQDSVMAGLNCGTPSPVAWPDLAGGLDAVVAVTDAEAEAAMRELATMGVVAGESGAASLAGAAAVARDADARRALHLDATSTVLLVSTEGATDPENYRRVVGADPAAVSRRS